VRLSIVHAVLNSPEIVRRQMLHYEKLGLGNDVEVIIVDDGSDPPVSIGNVSFNMSLYKTNDFRPWTQPAARNFGVKQARGEYALCLDLDHIVPRKTIDFLLSDHGYDIVRFRRECGVLDENGDFTQDIEVMREWGLESHRGLKLPPHGNSYAMRTGLYLGLGGVSEQHVGTGKYPNREELPLKKKIKELGDRVSILEDQTKPKIYMFPNGQYCGSKDYNPFGFFHDTTRSIRVSKRRQRRATV